MVSLVNPVLFEPPFPPEGAADRARDRFVKMRDRTSVPIVFYEEVPEHVPDLAERLNGIGGIPAASFAKLAELCCFE